MSLSMGHTHEPEHKADNALSLNIWNTHEHTHAHVQVLMVW